VGRVLEREGNINKGSRTCGKGRTKGIREQGSKVRNESEVIKGKGWE
jgi:hypothetical protein